MVRQPNAQQNLDARVEFFSFCFQEADDSTVPMRYPDGLDMGADFLVGREGRIDVASAGHTHVAPLTVQVWDGVPPQEADEAWDIRGEAEIFSATGELSLWTFGGPAEESVELGTRDCRWRVRLFCSGRAEVARRAQLEVPHGVERYLAQFWPAQA